MLAFGCFWLSHWPTKVRKQCTKVVKDWNKEESNLHMETIHLQILFILRLSNAQLKLDLAFWVKYHCVLSTKHLIQFFASCHIIITYNFDITCGQCPKHQCVSIDFVVIHYAEAFNIAADCVPRLSLYWFLYLGILQGEVDGGERPMTEEDEIAMAIALSMEEAKKRKAPDSLCRSPTGCGIV